VDSLSQLHAAVIARPRDDRRERRGDALERVVVVVEDDHLPGVAETSAGTGVATFLGRRSHAATITSAP
jgi:hypothetical protein